jgi:hypothetical protein
VLLQTAPCPSVGKSPTFDTAWFAGTTKGGLFASYCVAIDVIRARDIGAA